MNGPTGIILYHLTSHYVIIWILYPNPIVYSVRLEDNREASLADIEIRAFAALITDPDDGWTLARVASDVMYKARHLISA